MDTFEPLETVDSIIPSQVEMEPTETAPKLKGRQRFLHSLQRISSSTSLASLGRKRAASNPYPSPSAIGSTISLFNIQSSQAGSSSSFARMVPGQQASGPTSAVGTPPLTYMNDQSNLAIRPLTANLNDGMLGNSYISMPGISRVGSDIPEIVEGSSSQQASMPAVKPRTPNPNFDFWRELPHELKLLIFGNLKPKELVRASVVSRLFYSICFDGQLWTCFDASEFYTDIPAESLAKIVEAAGPFVKDLNLRGCVQVEHYNRAEVVVKACKNLINATLEGCRNFQRATLHILLANNQKLAHLNLTDLAAVNNGSCKIVSKSCPQLESFNVSWCSHMDSRGLKMVIAGCRKLRDLRAGEVHGFGGSAGLEVATALFETNNLERLVLSGCSDLSDITLQTIMHGTDPEIDLLTNLPLVPPRKLRHLDLSRCMRLTDNGLESLKHNVPHLQGLQVSGCNLLTDFSLSGIVATTPQLTHLDLEEVSSLTNNFLSEHLAKSACAPLLEHLSVSYCEQIGDDGLLPLVRAATSLRALDMDNTGISDLVLAEAAAMVRTRSRHGAPMARPQATLRLVVFDCVHVTWTGVREILSRNVEMQSIGAYAGEVIALKCFYGWQMTVDEHLKRVLRGEWTAARRLEKKWAEHMVANEEMGTGGAGTGARRRRRRARAAAMLHADEEEGGVGMAGIGRRRRARSNGCAVM